MRHDHNPVVPPAAPRTARPAHDVLAHPTTARPAHRTPGPPTPGPPHARPTAPPHAEPTPAPHRTPGASPAQVTTCARGGPATREAHRVRGHQRRLAPPAHRAHRAHRAQLPRPAQSIPRAPYATSRGPRAPPAQVTTCARRTPTTREVHTLRADTPGSPEPAGGRRRRTGAHRPPGPPDPPHSRPATQHAIATCPRALVPPSPSRPPPDIARTPHAPRSPCAAPAPGPAHPSRVPARRPAHAAHLPHRSRHARDGPRPRATHTRCARTPRPEPLAGRDARRCRRPGPRLAIAARARPCAITSDTLRAPRTREGLRAGRLGRGSCVARTTYAGRALARREARTVRGTEGGGPFPRTVRWIGFAWWTRSTALPWRCVRRPLGRR